MTEKEAEEKWCPIMTRNCIVSKCMMWRWTGPEYELLDTFPTIGVPNYRITYSETDGYCGVGGKQ